MKPRELIEQLQVLPDDAELCVFLADEECHPVSGIRPTENRVEDAEGYPILGKTWWLIG